MNWLKVSEIEKETGINQVTIRRYINRHRKHLDVKKDHKSFLINRNSIETINKIRDFYSGNMTSEQVEEKLNNMSIPIVIEVDDGEKKVPINSIETLMELKRDNEEMKNLIYELSKKMDEQTAYIEKSINERDRRLMETLRTAQEVQAAALNTGKRKKRWLPWWN